MSGILVVCTGNVCRSPMAEAFLRAALERRLGEDTPTVASAGTAGWESSPATPEAVAAGWERGADLRAHRARRLTPQLVEDADLVVCMATEHRRLVERLAPGAGGRTFTIAELVRLLEAERPTGSLAERVTAAHAARNGAAPDDADIRDPLGDPIEGYLEVADELVHLAERLADALAPKTT
jgi:protein-tyrosine phosphatase